VNQCGNSIVLIGMMGAGKSSVGHCLRRRTGLDLFDVDDIVASKFGISIPEIFSKYGEEGFRQAETKALLGLPSTQQAIIVAGGGIMVREQNVNVLKRLGVVVWLDANEETLFARASQNQNRPLLQANDPRDAFSQILRARKPVYAKIADIRVDTSMLTDEEVAVAILSKFRRLRRDRRLGSPRLVTP